MVRSNLPPASKNPISGMLTSNVPAAKQQRNNLTFRPHGVLARSVTSVFAKAGWEPKQHHPLHTYVLYILYARYLLLLTCK